MTVEDMTKDYLEEFSINIDSKLTAILIRKDKNSMVTIKDLPEKTSMYFLQKSLQEGDSLVSGIFSNVLCFYNLEEISRTEIKLKEIPMKLQKKSRQDDKIVINGREIFLKDYEWAPNLEIKYDKSKKEKTIDNYLKKVMKTVQLQ
ncbi:MAG: hypothetical protein WD512_11270 [Candidatus Paceibacterota bacterium]